MTDLTQRLRRHHYFSGDGLMEGPTGDWVEYEQAADALDVAARQLAAKEAEISRLREALKGLLAELPPIGRPEDIGSVHTIVTVGTIGKARAALAGKE